MATPKRYLNRPSPPLPAGEHKYLYEVGNDGKWYESLPDKNGRFRWIYAKNANPDYRIVKQAKTSLSIKSKKRSRGKGRPRKSRKGAKKSKRKSRKGKGRPRGSKNRKSVRKSNRTSRSRKRKRSAKKSVRKSRKGRPRKSRKGAKKSKRKSRKRKGRPRGSKNRKSKRSSRSRKGKRSAKKASRKGKSKSVSASPRKSRTPSKHKFPTFSKTIKTQKEAENKVRTSLKKYVRKTYSQGVTRKFLVKFLTDWFNHDSKNDDSFAHFFTPTERKEYIKFTTGLWY